MKYPNWKWLKRMADAEDKCESIGVGGLAKPTAVVVTEGIESVWHYHISPIGDPSLSLCRKQTMRTSISIENWGRSSDTTRDHWCEKCFKLSSLKSEPKK